MKLDYKTLVFMSEKYGDSFYILEFEKLAASYAELKNAFSQYYPNAVIAYSYKTNYTPAICREIEKLGGYAEVVSEMEYELAKRVGVAPERIILNGPVKSRAAVENLLLNGGQTNIDSESELKMLGEICALHPDKKLRVGIRCNFDIYDGVISRFGIDAASQEFERVLRYVKSSDGLVLSGLHCHFAERSIEAWRNKVSGMLEIIERFGLKELESVDFGGGLFGRMGECLKAQFASPIPSFAEYAEAIALPFAKYFKADDNPPKLIIEPGSALSGDVMCFVTRVLGIKTVRGKAIATLSGSMFNINPTRKNLPITVYHKNHGGRVYANIDFGGYTCIESDYLYRGYCGELEEGDFVVFENAGSYSVVLKPPFILPNFPIISYDGYTGEIRQIKAAETFDDVFHTYLFN